MRKSFISIILIIMAVVVVVMLVVPSMPNSTKEILETEITESTEQDTEEILISETNIDELGETDNQEASEQTKYMGRQIENYEEPQTENLYARIFESQLRYRNTYQSNIVIVPQDIAFTDTDGYEWFDYDPKPHAYHETAQFVCYAIFTYYDGKVPCGYYTNFNESIDIHNGHSQSSMIFEVQTHGDKPLNICLDMYNYKIRVDEGVAKKNPNCKYGCCVD